ncbi:prothymosin alpha [Microtus ochrogaster]|uniref:Prothymosin alpha n=3 Tax=Cricetidae TaxID=337677 RepID=A0ABM0L9Q6_MICOH|nr:prothymosin alpha [Microtus ochrogaster]
MADAGQRPEARTPLCAPRTSRPWTASSEAAGKEDGVGGTGVPAPAAHLRPLAPKQLLVEGAGRSWAREPRGAPPGLLAPRESPTGCSEKPSLHCSRYCSALAAAAFAALPPASSSSSAADSGSSLARVLELDSSRPRCSGSPACPTMSDAAVDTSSEITTKDLKEKKEVVEEAENGRDAPANGNANEENGEQEADNEVDEEEEEGGEEEEEEEEGDGEEEDGDEDEEAEAPTGKRVAEDDEDDDVDTKKQKTDEDD